MSNQHAELSQTLAEQHITKRRAQAAQARLVRGARPPHRRRRSWTVGGWWQLARAARHRRGAASPSPQSTS
jgi:hypothetical protein